MLGRIFSLEPAQIEKLPLGGGKPLGLGQIDKREIRFGVVKRQQERRGLPGQSASNIRNQARPPRFEIGQRDLLPRHPNEFLRVQFFYRDRRWRQQFVRRTAGRADIDQKDPEQIVCQPLILIEQVDIVEIAGVLAVEGGMSR